MATARDKIKETATQSMCDYLRLRKVWFVDQKIKKSKADKKLKVRRQRGITKTT